LLGTSAAPTYFPIHSFEYRGQKFECVDGGLWANDPRLFALFSERVLHARSYRIYNIISFGTGQVNNDKPSKSRWGSTVSWLFGNPNIIDAMFEASTAMTLTMFPYMKHTGLVRFVKIQTLLNTHIKLDDIGSLDAQKQQLDMNLSQANSQICEDYDTAIKITWKMGVREENLGKMPVIELIPH